ncbi:MAG: helix-hairpin-helix domain-containing protein [Candidatus Acidiferrales bacterium]
MKRTRIAAVFIAACAFAAMAQKTPPAHPLDLNVANVKELEEVPGIGPKTAQAIVDFRHKSGRFHRVEDLLAIKGISQRKLDKMRPYLKVTPSAPPPAHKPPQPQ